MIKLTDNNERRALRFMAPFLILMLLFTVIVFGIGFLTSLTDAQGINPGKNIGLLNFKNILKDKYFWNSVYVSFKFAAVSVAIQIPAAFLISIWIESLPYKRTQSFLKAAFFIPSLINTLVAGILFRLLFTGEQCIANIIIGFLGGNPNMNWLDDKTLAFPLLVFVSFWQCIGFQIIYFSANLRSLDQSPYEAARIDGAGKLSILKNITLPLMKPALIFMTITSAVSSLLVFDLILGLFQYNIYDNVTGIILYIYLRAFQWDLEIGAASAAGWIAFFLILAVSLFQLKFFGLGDKHED